MSDVAVSDSTDASENSLRSGVLGLFDSVIMGIAGSAPAYSIAATTTSLFLAVGLGGPAALLFCGIPMFGIVFAFNYLGRVEANAGATYSWVRRAMHPILGFIAGWSLVVSALIFMVAATLPAGSNIVALFSTSLAGNKGLVTVLGAVFFLLMVAAVARGVTVTVMVQIVMSCIEVALLILFALLAILHGHHTHTFTWAWLEPHSFGGFGSKTFASGALIAAFYYWGWDVTANLNEETKGSNKIPGLGAIMGTIVVFLLFEVFTIATNLVLTSSQITNNSTDVLSVLGQTVWPGWGGKLVVVAVILSTIATLETTLIQVTRTLFAMGRDVTLPKALGRISPTTRTPLIATAVVTVISLALFIGSQFVGSVGTIMGDAISAIAVQICIYYAFAGFSVVILYRRHLFKSGKNFIFIFLWPLLGALFMVYLFVKVVPTLNTTTTIVSLGAVGLGVVPLAIYGLRGGNEYYTRPTKDQRVVLVMDLEENL